MDNNQNNNGVTGVTPSNNSISNDVNTINQYNGEMNNLGSSVGNLNSSASNLMNSEPGTSVSQPSMPNLMSPEPSVPVQSAPDLMSSEPSNVASQPSISDLSSTIDISKKSNKGLMILVTLLVVGACVVAFFLLNGKDKSKETKTNKTSNSSELIENNDSLLNDDTPVVAGEFRIATVGHKGHGKTALVSAISKYFGEYADEEKLDKAPEMIERGITISASEVAYETDGRKYAQYDFPEHLDIVKTLVSGAVEFDGAVVVISATDGPMPQTREHLKLLNDAGVSRVVVYLNNVDKVDDNDLLELVEQEVRELLSEYGFEGENTPIIKGSAEKALSGDESAVKSIKDLITCINKWIISKTEITEEASAHTKFKSQVYVLTKDEGGRHTSFFNSYRPQLYVEGTEVTSIFELPNGVEQVMPGDNIELNIEVVTPTILKKGTRFSIREGGRTVGVGLVTEIIQ